MIPEDLVELLQVSNPRAILLDRERYDSALIGIGYRNGDQVAVYSVPLLAESICLWERVGLDDAHDWIAFELLPVSQLAHGPILIGKEGVS